ncbi:hypothetical protein M707_27005, partial [Arthrobacter sp. AK-YN10]
MDDALSEVGVAGCRVVLAAMEHKRRTAVVAVLLHFANVDHMVACVVARHCAALEGSNRAVQHGHPGLTDFEESTHFAINVLASDQHVLSRQFATPASDKFQGAETTEGIAGVPVLDGAVATFQCRTVSRHDAGDHVIYVGEVEKY